MSKKLNKVAVVNMAFGAGSESKEGATFDKYIGIAPFYLLDVNPSVEQLQKLFPNRDYTQKPPSYEYNKEGEAKGIFVTFYMKANAQHKEVSHLNKEGEELNLITRCSYLLKNELNMNRDKTKVQVINDYGDTGWLTSEEFKSKSLPEYMIKNNYITTGMRPAYVGEEDLIKFLKTFIGIPDPRTYDRDTKAWSNKTGKELEAALCGFSVQDITKIIGGDVSPIKAAVKFQPNNQIKLALGVRTTSDNKEFQDVCTRIPIKFGTSDYKRFDKELTEMKNGGGYANSNFGSFPYKFGVYTVEATQFQESATPPIAPIAQDPFADFG